MDIYKWILQNIIITHGITFIRHLKCRYTTNLFECVKPTKINTINEQYLGIS